MPDARRHPALLVLKLVVMLVLLAGAVLCLMAVVGLLSDALWLRLGGALVVAILIPALLADRLLPETDPKPRGLVTAVFAASWLAFTAVFLILGGDPARAMLSAEGDRLTKDGYGLVGDVVDVLARRDGPDPVATAESPVSTSSTDAPVATTTSATATAIASATASASATAVATHDPPPPRGSTRSDCPYPDGPYGVDVGQVLSPALTWEGFAPGSDATTTITPRDLHDCDGKGGIDAVVIDTSQYG